MTLPDRPNRILISTSLSSLVSFPLSAPSTVASVRVGCVCRPSEGVAQSSDVVVRPSSFFWSRFAWGLVSIRLAITARRHHCRTHYNSPPSPWQYRWVLAHILLQRTIVALAAVTATTAPLLRGREELFSSLTFIILWALYFPREFANILHLGHHEISSSFLSSSAFVFGVDSSANWTILIGLFYCCCLESFWFILKNFCSENNDFTLPSRCFVWFLIFHRNWHFTLQTSSPMLLVCM